MHLDVRDLRSFYLRTRLGRAARSSLCGSLTRLWPIEEVKGLTMLGFGFATPLLRPYLAEARRVIAVMPGQQGVIRWPSPGDNVAVLAEETLWPIETGAIDRLLVMHGLETSDNGGRLLDECWRVLGPGGRALFVVPNRGGLWARRDTSPFGYGRPYTLGQLEAQLSAHSFAPERHIGALFMPPSHADFWLRTARLWERLGHYLPSRIAGGAILVEATKQIYAPRRPGLQEAIKAPFEALGGLAKPPPEPISQRRH